MSPWVPSKVTCGPFLPFVLRLIHTFSVKKEPKVCASDNFLEEVSSFAFPSLLQCQSGIRPDGEQVKSAAWILMCSTDEAPNRLFREVKC